MLVIGLTGGIGMGKSAAAEHFARSGLPVFNADACVHRLYEGQAVAAIEDAFPGVTREGRVDRKLLGQQVTGHPERLQELESIVHPMVVKAEIDFLREQERKGARMAVLEIPLLFETGAEKRVDQPVFGENLRRQRFIKKPRHRAHAFSPCDFRHIRRWLDPEMPPSSSATAAS